MKKQHVEETRKITVQSEPATVRQDTTKEPQTEHAPAPQSATPVETSAIMLEMSRIRTSPYNPRKSYDKEALRELAATLKEVGLIQPIRVRAKNGNYEIVCGERRYRAARLNGWKQIEAYVCEVSDEVARDMMLTENLQREDMPPMDEARIYKTLLEEGSDIYTLAAKYGKSDSYIYSRLRLNELIPEIAGLLDRKLIGIGIALEAAKCERHIQANLYEHHLQAEGADADSRTYGWRGKGVADFKELINRTYTLDLENYRFDKTDCLKCPSNTNNYDLFAQCRTCGRCTNEKCLSEKNEAYVLAKTRALLQSDPRVSLGVQGYSDNDDTISRLSDEGHTPKNIGYIYYAMPTEPTPPERENFASDEEFAEAENDYQSEKEKFDRQTEEIRTKAETGEARMFVKTHANDAQIVWVPVNKRPTEPDFVKRLEQQKKSNENRALEKTVEDVRELVRSNSEPQTDFTLSEAEITFFIMLHSLREANRSSIDETWPQSGWISDEQMLAAARRLTPAQRNIVSRDYIADYLTKYTVNPVCRTLLLQFAQIHYPDQYERIKAEHDEVCENRNKRLDERIAEFEARERVRKEAEERKAAKEIGKGKPEVKPDTKKKTKNLKAQPQAAA